MNKEQYNLIAIDIAKDSLQVYHDDKSESVTYNPKGLAHLCRAIGKLKKPWVICEATGGYERPLMALLYAKGITVTLVNPARVRAFAKSEGIRAKTDPIDARVLLRFAQEKSLQPTPPPEPQNQELAALMDRRSHLTEQLAREKNRRQKGDPFIGKSIARMIIVIEDELQILDQKIRELIDTNCELHANSQIFLSVQGIGEVTAWTLLAYLREIPHLGRNQLVALAGLAPFNRDSGKSSSKRSIQGGRAKVRKCLYMAAQSAALYNPVIRDYVARLRERGKPYKCAIVAAMRKLLIHLQSLLKNYKKCLA